MIKPKLIETSNSTPVCCGECYPPFWAQGLDNMIQHVKANHPDYSGEEAVKYAQLWLEDSYVRMEQAGVDYADYRKTHKQNGDY